MTTLDINQRSEAAEKIKEILVARFGMFAHHIEVVPVKPPAFQVLLTLKSGEKRSTPTIEAIVACGAEHDAVLYPIVFEPQRWQRTTPDLSPTDWQQCHDQLRHPEALIDYFRRQRKYPRNFRETLLDAADDALALVEHVQRTSTVPPHLQLSVFESIMIETLSLFFLAVGMAPEDDLAAISALKRHAESGAKGPNPKHMVLLFQIRGLISQTRLQASLGATDRRAYAEVGETAKRVTDYLKSVEEFAREKFTTPQERKRAKLIRTAWAAVAGVGVIAGIIASVLVLQPETSIAPTPGGKPGGVNAEYFSGIHLRHKVASRIDNRISVPFNGAPIAGLKRNNYSIRWKGKILFPEAGSRLLCTNSDDGARLMFNGRELITDWKNHPPKQNCKRVRVKKGWYPFTLEYFQGAGSASIRLADGPSEDKLRAIANKRLCCP